MVFFVSKKTHPAQRRTNRAMRILSRSMGFEELEKRVMLASKVYIAPDDHTDYFWTASDVEYRQAFIDTLL